MSTTDQGFYHVNSIDWPFDRSTQTPALRHYIVLSLSFHCHPPSQPDSDHQHGRYLGMTKDRAYTLPKRCRLPLRVIETCIAKGGPPTKFVIILMIIAWNVGAVETFGCGTSPGVPVGTRSLATSLRGWPPGWFELTISRKH
jgi:hypothetical protein